MWIGLSFDIPNIAVLKSAGNTTPIVPPNASVMLIESSTDVILMEDGNVIILES